jgi:hypothetical protein
MHRIILWLGLAPFLVIGSLSAATPVLMVADEFPALEVVAAKLKAATGIASELIAQSAMPASLSSYSAVVVYIHGNLVETTETALIRYAKEGGHLVALHHSISSGKRRNREWFQFLGVTLPEGSVEQGGYKWIEPAELQIVNLAPNNYITSNQVAWSTNIECSLADKSIPRSLPGLVLPDSEVYLNHHLDGSQTPLLGLVYQDRASRRNYEQPIAGWIKRAGRGRVVYLMGGHSARDFENPGYGQIVVNAIRAARVPWDELAPGPLR